VRLEEAKRPQVRLRGLSFEKLVRLTISSHVIDHQGDEVVYYVSLVAIPRGVKQNGVLDEQQAEEGSHGVERHHHDNPNYMSLSLHISVVSPMLQD